MADEYIRREDAIDYIEGFVTMNKYYHPHSKRTTIPIEEAIARINETPSADVQPVVHGKWIPEIEQMETEYSDSTEVHLETFQTGWKCSECDDYSVFDSNFCPNCGADMRGET